MERRVVKGVSISRSKFGNKGRSGYIHPRHTCVRACVCRRASYIRERGNISQIAFRRETKFQKREPERKNFSHRGDECFVRARHLGSPQQLTHLACIMHKPSAVARVPTCYVDIGDALRTTSMRPHCIRFIRTILIAYLVDYTRVTVTSYLLPAIRSNNFVVDIYERCARSSLSRRS